MKGDEQSRVWFLFFFEIYNRRRRSGRFNDLEIVVGLAFLRLWVKYRGTNG